LLIAVFFYQASPNNIRTPVISGILIKKLMEETNPTASSSIPAITELMTPNKGIGANTNKQSTGFNKTGIGKT
jgi:hypothetical protein